MSEYSFDYIFNSSAERYADVGYVAHWTAIAFVESVILFGLAITIAVGFALKNDPVLYKSFAVLCMWQSVCDVVCLIIHGFVMIPIFAIREQATRWVEIAGIGALSYFFFAEHAIISVISMNRFLAITNVEAYTKWFTLPKCKTYVLASFLFPCPIIVYCLACPNYLDVVHYVNSYEIDCRYSSWPCGYVVLTLGFLVCYNVQAVLEQGTPVLMTAVILSIKSIRAVRKRARESNAQANPEQLNRQRRVLMTSALNSFCQVIVLSVYNMGGPILISLDFRLAVLFPTTLMWAIASMFNSIVLVIYNPSVRNYVLCRMSKVAAK